MFDWQPIATAPKDGTMILLCFNYARKERRVANGRWLNDKWWTPFDSMVRATHWAEVEMPK